MAMISILSYNIHFGRKLDEILRWLSGMEPIDIICFQEFPKHKIRDFVRALSKYSYGYRFAPSIGANINKEYGVLTLFRKNILKPVSFRKIALGINIIEKAWFKGNVARHSLLSVFRQHENIFVMANTHLVSSAPNSHRYRQINTILRALRKNPHPVVIVGDYNIPSITGTKKLIQLMSKNNYRTDKKRIVTHHIAGIRYQVDYVFWRDCTIRALRALKVRYSDHYPLRFTMSLSNSSRLHVARQTRISAAP
jgi:endonuclease/exonuclease/phosphatase family metal-dependent hydrolase